MADCGSPAGADMWTAAEIGGLINQRNELVTDLEQVAMSTLSMKPVLVTVYGSNHWSEYKH